MSYQACFHEPLPAGSEVKGLFLPPPSLHLLEECEEHEESLSLFCLDDLEPLCELCAAERHVGHRVYPSTEAAIDCKNQKFKRCKETHIEFPSESKKQHPEAEIESSWQEFTVFHKDTSAGYMIANKKLGMLAELGTSVRRLNKKMGHSMKVIQTCEQATTYNQSEAKLTEEHMKQEFEKLHQFLRDEEAVRLAALREEQEEKMRRAEEWIDNMNEVIQSLEEKIQLVEEEIITEGEGVEFLQNYKESMNSSWIEDKKPATAYRLLINVAQHLGNLLYAVWEKMKHIAPFTPVTLDSRTVGQSLMVSAGFDSVQITPGALVGLEESTGGVGVIPANPERFHSSSCILAEEGFDAGVHCWDVEVGDTDNWTLGVAAQWVCRETEFEACPEAGLWCISLRDGEYRALTSPSRIIHIDGSHPLHKITVRLDWEEGTLEFMNGDTEEYLFTFQHRFSEMVFPYFESKSVDGRLSVLARRVNISVGSDYGLDEDSGIIAEDQVIKTASEKEEMNALTNGNDKIVNGHSSDVKTNVSKQEKKKTSNNKTVVKKQKTKRKFNVTYHVSLNRALKSIHVCEKHKQTMNNNHKTVHEE